MLYSRFKLHRKAHILWNLPIQFPLGQCGNPTKTADPEAARANTFPMNVRKFIIYLYPPSSLPDVTVELLLTPTWSFSAVYQPPQTVTPSGEHQAAQSLIWAIAAEPCGTLVDKTSGTEVSCLYWEAMLVV